MLISADVYRKALALPDLTDAAYGRHALQLLVQGRNFNQAPDIAPGSDGNDHMRQLDPEDRVRLAFDANTVNLFHLVPVH